MAVKTGRKLDVEARVDATTKPSILVAEDNVINQKLAELLFKNLNLTITIANNGKEAVNAVLGQSFDMVLMDIQMPQMTGIEATQALKEELGDLAPPIVALTANALPGDRERFMEAGLDHYMTKPIDFEELKALVKELTLYQP